MPWRRSILLALALAPAVGAWIATRSAADIAATNLAAAALSAARILEPAQPQPVALPQPPLAPEEPLILDDGAPAQALAAASKHRSPGHSSKAVRRGVLVRRSSVLAAVRRGVRPSGAAVPATASHPAGLLVTGWGGAGTALRDGDIITSLGGRTPSSEGDVIAVVAGAYRAKVYAVSGQIWRNGETLSATVELPIPQGEEPTAAEAKPRDKVQRPPRSTGGPKERRAVR